ncbi:putative sporulation protein YtxC [Desulfitibacter alkalitolerans]|uniref:putative sporulation protein YtxC n=1 Tax=Desulfitibacter alkalitolerans TaxID=264641 RepID=UPI00048719A0|nr:putative sporulation protein YtxC [Desulfitibacter alkalitolerans]
MDLLYSIVTNKDLNFMYEELENQFITMREQGLINDLDIKVKGKYYFYELKLTANQSSNSLNNCINSLISTLTNLIVDKYKDIIIEKTIKNHYYYFDIDERRAISTKTENYLLAFNDINNQKAWKSRIYKRIIKHFENNNNLIIDGFVNFRLKDFCNEIQLAVEDSVEDYLLEKEYDEFVDLLKHLMHITRPKFKCVHIFFNDSGTFKLYNEELKGIEFYKYGVNLMDEDISYEDIVISSVISLAPKELVLHGFRNIEHQGLISTLRKVFGENRVIKCEGCIKCSHSYSKNK